MISYRKRGKTWEYRIRVQNPITGKRQETMKGGFRTKQEAIVAANQKELETLSTTHQAQGDLRLEQWLQDYMKLYREDKVAHNTYLADQESIKRILPYFQQITLKKITPELYQQFINDLQKRGYSRSTVRNTHILMHGAMQQAKINNRLNQNPCQEAKLPPKTSQDKLQYLTSDTIAPFLAFIKQRNLEQYFFFKALLETGMRKGEALALTWDDVDLDNQSLRITKSYTVKTKRIGPTKNGKHRTIRFSSTLKNDLLFLSNHQNQQKFLLGEFYDTQSNLVFAAKDGTHLKNSTLFNTMKQACETLEIDPLPIHSLRHTHAVLQLEAGTNMKVIQERLGHGSLEITSNIYAHVSETLEQDSMDRYEEATKRYFESS